MDLSQFEFDRKIDPDALDVACIQQTDLFFRWAERSIQARGEVDRLKLKLDTLLAEVEIKIRKKPGKYGLEKITDASVKATSLIQPEYLEAYQNYLSARDDANLLEKAVVAMEIKKRMIESLITLHGQSYFAGPSAPRNLKEMYLRQQEAVTERVNKKQISIARKRGAT